MQRRGRACGSVVWVRRSRACGGCVSGAGPLDGLPSWAGTGATAQAGLGRERQNKDQSSHRGEASNRTEPVIFFLCTRPRTSPVAVLAPPLRFLAPPCLNSLRFSRQATVAQLVYLVKAFCTYCRTAALSNCTLSSDISCGPAASASATAAHRCRPSCRCESRSSCRSFLQVMETSPCRGGAAEFFNKY